MKCRACGETYPDYLPGWMAPKSVDVCSFECAERLDVGGSAPTPRRQEPPWLHRLRETAKDCPRCQEDLEEALRTGGQPFAPRHNPSPGCLEDRRYTHCTCDRCF